MRQKAETWQSYRGTTQTKERNPKPGNFALRVLKLGMESSFAYLCKKLIHF
jgi:hypothetical protein